MNNLEIINLNKKYSDFHLNKINLTVPKGKIIGFIGLNGSGKTTTIKAILNLISWDKGQIKIFNKKNTNLTKEDKEKIGIVLDDSFFAPMLNAKDINKIMQNFYHKWDAKLYFNYLKDFKIPLNRSLKDFSSGMKMKIKIICAISHNPKILILDEPTSGLDPVFRYDILELFAKFVSNNENSVLMTSHITSDLEHIADEIVFIHEGKIILDVDKQEVTEKYGLIELKKSDITKIKREDYFKSLEYKDEFLLLVQDKQEFTKKYPKILTRKPSLEEIMLLYIKGE